MNRLLKRQIRKYLPKDLEYTKDFDIFLDAVNRSYNTSDDQFSMLQRATSISSDELFEANAMLEKELDSQKEVIKKLKNVVNTLKFYNLKEAKILENSDLDSSKLVDFINDQTKEIIKINQQRDRLLENLELQNQELNDYAHMVSHDLKSPLRNIDSLSAWLKEDYKDKLDDTGNNRLHLIRNNVEKMDTLINGILQYSTIGKDRIDVYDVDTNVLFDTILTIIEIPTHINIIRTNLPIVKGNKYSLQQLFQNLIDNAIAYNDKEKGKIIIGATDQGEFWEFYIKDNGMGIEQAYFDKIFRTFETLKNNVQSTGIGLSIVKKIVNLYGGEIWLTSKINEGSTFYFTLKK